MFFDVLRNYIELTFHFCAPRCLQLLLAVPRMSLADSRRYVGYHWPHPAWPDDAVEVLHPTAEAASKVLLEACEAHENGENQREARGSKMGAS